VNKPLLKLLTLLVLCQPAWAAESPRVVAEHHLHLRSEAAADLLSQIQQNKESLESLPNLKPITGQDILAALNAAAVPEALVISSAYLFSMPDLNPSGEYSLVMRENDYTAEQVAIAPDRLSGLCSVNPLAEYALDEIQRCAQRLGLKGLHLHFENSDIDLRSSAQIRKLATVFGFLEALQFPVLIHTRTREPDYGSIDIKLFIDKVLSEAPSIVMQIAHLAGSGGYDDGADRAMAQFTEAFIDGRLESSNFQFDLAGVIVAPNSALSSQSQQTLMNQNKQLSNRIIQLDPQQVLFATGWPTDNSALLDDEFINTNAKNIARLLSLNPEQLKVLYQNRSRLLD